MGQREISNLGHGDAVSKELTKMIKIAVEQYDSIATALG
jgi:hypothetical protein